MLGAVLGAAPVPGEGTASAGVCSCGGRSKASGERCGGASGRGLQGGAVMRFMDEGKWPCGAGGGVQTEGGSGVEGQGTKGTGTGRGQCGRNMVASGVLSSDF